MYLKTLALCIFLFSTCFAHAEGTACGDLDDYEVLKTSFSDVNLQTAFSKLTKDMPFQIVMVGDDNLKVSASNVSGSLGGVLDKFSKEAGFSYKKNRCIIEVSITKKTPVSWTLREGRYIGKELQAWGDIAGWKVIWNLPKDITVPANTTFNGDFKAAATEVISTLSENGALIRAHFADANKILIIVGPGVSEQ